LNILLLKVNALKLNPPFDRTFISLSDNKNIIISKHLDDDNAEIISLLDDVSDNDILDELRFKISKSLSMKLGDV
jgi:hypothetical protein